MFMPTLPYCFSLTRRHGEVYNGTTLKQEGLIFSEIDITSFFYFKRIFTKISAAFIIGVVFLLTPAIGLTQKQQTDYPFYTQNYPLEQTILFASYNPNLIVSKIKEAQEEDRGGVLLSISEGAFLPLNLPLEEEPIEREIRDYTVKQGDTVTFVAEHFHMSPSTIMWANNLSEQSTLKVGSVLHILPVDGVLHKVRQGETIGELSLLYQTYTEDIIEVNELSNNGFIIAGDTLIIPGGKPLPPKPKPQKIQLAEIKGGIVNPAPGAYRSQGLHYNNGVDLARSCGSPVLAAMAGSVVKAKSGGWNGGFGKYVMIAHANGIVTVYGHLQGVFVTLGQAVSAGEEIGLMGATGHATGCHVHFEVRGAKNPFAY